MKPITLSREHYIEVMNELAHILADECGDDLPVHLDEETDTYTFTEEGQVLFNIYIDRAEKVMVHLGFGWEA